MYAYYQIVAGALCSCARELGIFGSTWGTPVFSCVVQLCLPYGIFHLEIYDARRYFLTLVHGVRIYIERSPMENPICERALSVLFVHLIVVECNHSFYVNLFIFYTLDIIYNTTILLIINGWFQLRGKPER